ncbi:MAG TPA: transglutaminaseTgpA domain-containing protein [Oscillospiraceae bacterium]|nr:transglutaminaseTgpA domain-containing protein [Oscillospiraceae bacterium]
MHFVTKQKKADHKNGIDINSPKQQEHKDTATAICSQILLILLAVFGVTFSFIGSFGVKVLPAILTAYLFLFVLIFVLAFAIKKWTKFILPSVFLLFFAAGWFFYHDIIQGFILTSNSILASFTAHSDWVFNVYDVEPATTQQYVQMTTVFLLFILFVITGIVSSAIMRSKSFFSVFFITFPPILAALIFTISPPLLPLLLLSTCWAVLAIQQISIHKVRKSRKKTDLSETLPNRTAHQLNYFSMIAVALCFALILCIFPQSTYVRDPGANEARNKLQNFVEQSSLFSSWQTGGINGGNLKSSGDLTFTGETVLRIKTDDTKPLYLRAFAGSTYTGDKWEPISDEIYNQHSSAFSTLNGKSLNPQNMTAKYFELCSLVDSHTNLNASKAASLNQYSITVQNVHANKHYVYAPYGLITTPANLPDTVFANDGYIKADSWFGISDYSMKAYYPYTVNSGLNFRSANLQSYYKADYRKQLQPAITERVSWAEDYINDENAYRNFLYDYNTALPDDIKQKVIKLCQDNHFSSDNLDAEINAVQTYLATNCQYTLSPGKTPANRDFVDYFLFENRKGYCVHFATAATILLRAMGIPARYVEGYVANANDLAALDSDGYTNIKDSRAHAWTEVYIPVYGWVPVETTPGFYQTDSSNLATGAGEEPTPSQETASGTPSSKGPEKKVAPDSEPESSMPASSSLPSSSSASSGIIGQADNGTNIVANGSISPVIPIACILLLLIVLLAIIYGNRKYAIRWRKQNFHLQDTNKSALAIYDYILKIFAFYDYKYKHDIPMQEFAKRAIHDLWILHDNEFMDITQIAQKACFSQHKVTEKELAVMYEFAESLVKTHYPLLSRRKKLLFRYWHRLN